MDGEQTNEMRAEQAFRALHNSPEYGATLRGGDTEAAITDLMTDLLHLANQHGLDIDVLLERIARHHRDEEGE